MVTKKKPKAKAGKILSDKQLLKKYPTAGIASKVCIETDDSLWIPSRNMYLNWVMGGGLKYGKICEIFGSESSGKTLVAKDFSFGTQYLGGWVLWNDAEQAFDPTWAIKNGLDLDKIIIYNETSIEKISDWVADMAITLRSRLTHNEPILFVQDSIAALDCEANVNSVQTDAKAEMGNRAKAIYKFVRIRNQLLAELGVTSIFINQLRSKVGATQYEDPDTTPGGGAMKFFASQRMAFFRKKQITIGSKENKIWIGNECSVRMKKNKLAPPRSSFTTELYFTEDDGHQIGFSRYHGLSDVIEKAGAIERAKGASRAYYKGKLIANGKDALQKVLEEDRDLRSKLLMKAGINTLSKTENKIRRLNAKGVNRYPVILKPSKSDEDV